MEARKSDVGSVHLNFCNDGLGKDACPAMWSCPDNSDGKNSADVARNKSHDDRAAVHGQCQEGLYHRGLWRWRRLISGPGVFGFA